MNFKKDRDYNLKNHQLVFGIFLIILIFVLVSSVSASKQLDMDNSDYNTIIEDNGILTFDDQIQKENRIGADDSVEYEDNVISTNSVYNISADATNDEIQSIFDNSKSGDTIQFNDKEYNDISIVVNKKLNIVSTRNSIIHTSDSISAKASEMGISNSFGFYFTKLSAGSVIKGLRFTGNSDYEIMVEGGDEISIINNTISGGKKGGILLRDSKYNVIDKNTITKAYDGIVLENVNRTKISYNKIYSNRNIGLNMEDVFLNNITNNSIYKNGLDGVLIKDAKSNRILNNNITKNGVSGLRLEGYTTRNIIMHNNISSNVVNIYANSLTNGDQITQNTLMFAKRAYGSYVEDDNVGAAIVFADNYQAAKQGNMLFSHNSIGANDVWDAKSTMSHPAVNIGANWYFDNDGNYAVGHICPMVFGRAITADELKTLSMGFGGDENGLFGQLYDGNNPQGAGAFTIDNVNVNGKDYGSIEVGEDGRFSLNDLDFDELPAGSVITITVGGHSFNVTINERIISNKTKTNDTAETAENDSYPDEENLPIKEGASPQGTKNGAGSGTGSLNGSGSGEGNFTGSGISVGTLSGQSNAGTGDSGENGGGSASEGLNAYEILKEENTPTTAKNSQLIAVFAVALVILIIALGYRSKNKDDYNDDGDYSL
jgi:parallel beta-helix repeat protein